MLKKGIVMLMLFKLNLNLNLSLNIGETDRLELCFSVVFVIKRTILCTISNLLRCIQSIILKPSNLFNILNNLDKLP